MSSTFVARSPRDGDIGCEGVFITVGVPSMGIADSEGGVFAQVPGGTEPDAEAVRPAVLANLSHTANEWAAHGDLVFIALCGGKVMVVADHPIERPRSAADGLKVPQHIEADTGHQRVRLGRIHVPVEIVRAAFSETFLAQVAVNHAERRGQDRVC